MNNQIEIYTDGSCSRNPGPAGIGVLLQYEGVSKEISEYIGEATNKVAELMAIRKGLLLITKRDFPIIVYTDSEYCIGILTKGWKGTKNLELVAEIKDLISLFSDLKMEWVKGHSGNNGNETADRLASLAVKRRK